MRVVQWNIEHMNSWFVPNDDPNSPAFRASYTGGSFGGGPIDDVEGLARHVAGVLAALDPDVICLQEGAGDDEVALFLDRFLPLPNGATWSLVSGAGGAQKLMVAVRTDRGVTAPQPANDDPTTQLSSDYTADTDGDGVLESDTRFARLPLVVDLQAHGEDLRIVNCHLKSKYVPSGESLWNGSQAERREFVRAALVNRRRISAEAFRIRTYLDDVFRALPDKLLLATGDLNDGPGFDHFERLYLTHSVVDLVFGSVLEPVGRLTHPLIQPGLPRPASAYFDDFVDGTANKPLLLDHIGLSPALADWLEESRVADAEYEAESDPGAANERERFPSDHRPTLTVLTP